MNSTNETARLNGKRLENISCLLSSAGCSWNMNEPKSLDEQAIASSLSLKEMPFLKVTYPSFSLTDDRDVDQDDEEDDGTKCSTHQRERVQSKASELMSRKRVYSRSKVEDNIQQQQKPHRVMLENILDSFDELVDARIRAYARILRNHVRALLESNNIRGARVAEYKLQTLLEVAANRLSFDSISTEFKITGTDNDVSIDYSIGNSSAKSMKEEKSLCLPIELNVEIRSPRFFHEGLESDKLNDIASPPHESHRGSLRFRAKGECRVEERRNSIGPSAIQGDDTNICSSHKARLYRNRKNHSRALSIYRNENIEIDINCSGLLLQMIEEASKVVIMAVELTNKAWTNDNKKEEISELNMNALVAENSSKVTNIIMDDDDDDNGFISNKRFVERTTGKRSRCDVYPESGNQGNSKMSKQVSEISFDPNVAAVREDEYIEKHHDTSASNTTVTTITNLHILDEDADRKTRYFVSDPSYDSSGSEHDPTAVCEDQKLPPLHEYNDDEDESYNISPERACHIVDFVLAGDIIPSSFSSNKKLRTK